MSIQTTETPSPAAFKARLLATFNDRPELREEVRRLLEMSPEERAAREANETQRRRETQRIDRRVEHHRECGLVPAEFKHTFAKFVFAGTPDEKDNQAAMCRLLRAWCEQFPHGDRGICITGDNGVGKDFCLHMVINQLFAMRDLLVRYWHSLEWDKAVRDEWGRKKKLEDEDDEESNVERLAKSCDLLAIGDLHIICHQNHQPTIRQAILRVLDQAARTGKPIIICTSNLDQPTFDAECLNTIGDRAAQLFDYRGLLGPSRRRMRT